MTAPTSLQVPNGSTPISPKSPTSVFNALGSYADRIRDKDMKDGLVSTGATPSASSSKKSPKPPAPADLPNGSTPHPAAASSSVSTSTTKSSKPITTALSNPSKAATPSIARGVKEEKEKEVEKVEQKEEEGAWETVPAGKPRRKERESNASTNWRDRPREKKESSSGWRGEDGEKGKGEGRKKGGQASGINTNSGQGNASTTRSASSNPAPTPSLSGVTATPAAATRSASVTPATTTRKAWGVITPSASTSSTLAPTTSTTSTDPRPGQGPSAPSPISVKPAPIQTSKPNPTARTSTPPSPSVTGGSTAVNPSIASPNLSATAETSSTTTMVTPRGGGEDEEDWRMRPRKLSSEMVEKDIPSLAGDIQGPAAVKEKEAEALVPVKENIQAAPPPTTNAWAERKKAMGAAVQPASILPSLPAFPAAISSDSVASKSSTITPSASSSMASKTALPGKPAALLFGSVDAIDAKSGPNGTSKGAGTDEGVKIGSMKKKKSAQSSSTSTRHMVDTNAFPDLAQAASKAKKVEVSKKDEESVADDAGNPARKTKWTAIPAAELLAAADEAKRHAQSTASRQKHQSQHSTSSRPSGASSNHHHVSTQAESSLSPSQKQLRKKTPESRRGRVTRSGSGSEIRLPPIPSPRRESSSTAGGSGEKLSGGAFKPVFGSIDSVADKDQQSPSQNTKPKEQPVTAPVVNGGSSEPVSRQSTSTTQVLSPPRSITQLPSPTLPSTELKDTSLLSAGDMAGLRLGSGPLSPNGTLVNGSNGTTGSNTAPMLQSGFPMHGGPPRAARGGRQSFSSGRGGRGGYRGGFKPGMGQGMPDQGFQSNGSNGRGAGGGTGGFSTFVPHQQQHGGGAAGGMNGTSMSNGNANGNGSANGYEQAGQGMYAVWDQVQGYAMPSVYGTPGGTQGRQGLPMPPPPMPVTHAAGLDALRFYVLGQVEYYFSMQNLAMDFFLRQQMDSEGWIDIAMITSFNRIKSLTPDPSIIKEVMLLSSLLEVRDDKVRLSYGESKRWILPDAKPSPYVDDGTNASSDDGGESGLGLSVGWGSIPINNGTEAEKKGLGLGMEGRGGLAQEVKDALMKPSPSGFASNLSLAGAASPTITETKDIAVNGDVVLETPPSIGSVDDDVDEKEDGKGGLELDKGGMEKTDVSVTSSQESEKIELS